MPVASGDEVLRFAQDDRNARQLLGARLEQGLEVGKAERGRLGVATLALRRLGGLPRLFGHTLSLFGRKPLGFGLGRSALGTLGALALALGFLDAPALELALLALAGGFEPRLLARGELRIVGRILLLGLLQQGGTRLGLR